MSTWHDREIQCPCCATRIVVKVASGLHITRLPHVRDAIIQGELHRFDCASCKRRVEVRQPLIYTDFDRGHWFEVRPAEDIARWQALAPSCTAMFERAIGRGAPILRERMTTFCVRLVFGYDELREKIVLADAGHDDVAVECLKLLAIRHDPSIFGFTDRLLVRNVEGERLTVDRHRSDGLAGSLTLMALRDELARIRTDVEAAVEPAFNDPFVSLNRAIGKFAAARS
jgi:hypothetical protein